MAKQKMDQIIFNDQFSMKWDGIQWHLADTKAAVKSSAKSSTVTRVTYHGTLKQVLGAITERSIGEVQGGIAELQVKLEELAVVIENFNRFDVAEEHF